MSPRNTLTFALTLLTLLIAGCEAPDLEGAVEYGEQALSLETPRKGRRPIVVRTYEARLDVRGVGEGNNIYLDVESGATGDDNALVHDFFELEVCGDDWDGACGENPETLHSTDGALRIAILEEDYEAIGARDLVEAEYDFDAVAPHVGLVLAMSGVTHVDLEAGTVQGFAKLRVTGIEYTSDQRLASVHLEGTFYGRSVKRAAHEAGGGEGAPCLADEDCDEGLRCVEIPPLGSTCRDIQ